MGDINWGQASQGAMGGAAAGAAFGPWGAAIGGGIGGAMGLLGGGGQDQYKQQLMDLSNKYGNMQAPQMGQAAQGQYSGFRGAQAGLIGQLQAMASGQGPSAAAIQMRDAMDRAAGAQASAAAGAGGRGVNAGAAMRNAQNNTAAVQGQGARDTATLRSQEQMGAMSQLGQVTAQGRAADENMNQYNATAQNQQAQANLQAKLQTLGITSQAQLQSLMAAIGITQPGTGTSVMAGGAMAAPLLMQYMHGQQGNGGAGGAQAYQSPGYYNSGGIDDF